MKEPMKCEQMVDKLDRTSSAFSGFPLYEKGVCGGELEEKGKLQVGEVVITEKNVYYPSETTIYQCKVCKDIVIK